MSEQPEWRREGSSILLRVPYNEDFLAEFKSEIPQSARRWRPKPARCWVISREYQEDVRRLVLAFYRVDLGTDPQPASTSRNGSTSGSGSDFSEPDPGRMRTPDGIAVLKAQLQAAHEKNAQIDFQCRLLRQHNAVLQSQLEMERAGRPSGNSDGFGIREFLRLFGARGFKSLVRVSHPDVNGSNEREAAEFTKRLTILASEMGLVK